MVPESVESLHAGCVKLFAYIDRKTSGPNGRPEVGFRAAAEAIGVKDDTVGEHARHLAEYGYIHLDMGTGKAHKGARMWIRCNPARMVCTYDHAPPKPVRKHSKSALSSTGTVAQKAGKGGPKNGEPCGTEKGIERGTENGPRSRYAGMEGMERSGTGSPADQEKEHPEQAWCDCGNEAHTTIEGVLYCFDCEPF